MKRAGFAFAILFIFLVSAETHAQQKKGWTGSIDIQIDLDSTYVHSKRTERLLRLPQGGPPLLNWRETTESKSEHGDRHVRLDLENGVVKRARGSKRGSKVGHGSWSYARESWSLGPNENPADDYFWNQIVGVETIDFNEGDVKTQVELQEDGTYAITLEVAERIAVWFAQVDRKGRMPGPDVTQKEDEKDAKWSNTWSLKLKGSTCDPLLLEGGIKHQHRLAQDIDRAYSSWYLDSRAPFKAQIVDPLKTPLYASTAVTWKLRRQQAPNESYAFRPAIEFPVHQTVKVPGGAQIPIKLTTCQNLPLSGQALTLTTSFGKLDAAQLKTDASGRTQALLTSLEDPGLARVGIDYDVADAKGLKRHFHEEALVEFIKPRQAFTGELTVRATTLEKEYDSDGNVSARTERDAAYRTTQKLTLQPEVFSTRTARPAVLAQCNSAMACPVLSGSNDDAPFGAPAKRTPVTLVTRSRRWELIPDDDGNNRMVLVQKEEGGGQLTDYTVTSAISLIKRPPQEPELPDSSDLPPAVPLTNPDYYFRFGVAIGGFTPNPNPAAPKSQSEHFDTTSKKWIKDEPSRYGLSVPEITVLKTLLESSSTPERVQLVKQPAVPESLMLRMMRNPDGSFSFKTWGRLVEQELEGSAKRREIETTVHVTLTAQ